MFQTAGLSSFDFTNYNWPEDELARFGAYIASLEPLSSPNAADRGDKQVREAQLRSQPQLERSVGGLRPRSEPGSLGNDPLAQLTPLQIFHDCIWISDEDTHTKIMLLCISRFMDRRTLRGSSMSYAQIAKACGFSNSTAIRSAKAARDRWLRIEVNRGRYVPGKGSENLYHGVVPARWVEELRRQRRRGQDIKIDEGIVKAADGVVAGMTGVSDSHPEASSGVFYRHRGVPQTEPECPTDTLTLYHSSKDDEEEGERARAVGLVETTADKKLEHIACELSQLAPKPLVVVAELEDRFTALACRIDAGCSEADARKAFHNLHRDVQATQGEFTSAGLPLALRAAENNLRAKSLQGLGNFLAKAWPQQSDVARASYQQALAATAISAAKVESEQQIAAIRRNALETSIASGGAKATAKAAGNRGGRYDGGRFGVECAKIIQIGEVWVTGLDANDIQSAAPGSTPQDVEAVLTDLRARIAGEKPRRGWVAKAEPSIESIIGRSKKILVARRLYDDRGPPEQHAGGEAGRLGEHVFAADFAVVTQSTLERWRAGYPEGINEKWGYDIGGSAFTAFRNAATALDAAERYGRGLQKDVEAATEAAIAKTQREHDSEEIARLRDKDRDSLNAAWLKAGRPPFQSFEVQWREARRSAESAA